MTDPSESRAPTTAWRWEPWLLPVLFAAYALVWCWLHFYAYQDDAFIFFRYVDNLFRHGELVFNPGERVEGFTSPLWVLLLASTQALGISPLLGAGLWGAACLIALFWISLQDAHACGLPSPFAWLPALAMATCFPLLAWAVSGMETLLFVVLLWLGLSIYRQARAHHTAVPLTAGVAVALAALARPEGGLLILLLWVHQGWLLWRGAAAPFASRRSLLRLMLPPMIAGATLLLARWLYYGDILPNTFYAKAGSFSRMAGLGLQYIGGFVKESPLLWFAPLLLLARQTPTPAPSSAGSDHATPSEENDTLVQNQADSLQRPNPTRLASRATLPASGGGLEQDIAPLVHSSHRIERMAPPPPGGEGRSQPDRNKSRGGVCQQTSPPCNSRQFSITTAAKDPPAAKAPRPAFVPGAPVWGLGLWFVGLYLLYLLSIGGDHFDYYRFLVPLLPLTYAWGAAGLYALWRRWRPHLASQTLRSPSAWIGVGAVLLMVTVLQYHPALWRKHHGLPWITGCAKLGQTLRQKLPSTTTVALPHIGAVGYYSRLPIVDLLALTDRTLAHRPTQFPRDQAFRREDIGHATFDIPHSMARRPGVVIFSRAYGSRPFTHPSEFPLSFEAERQLMRYLRQQAAHAYQIHNVKIDRQAYWALFVRKDLVKHFQKQEK